MLPYQAELSIFGSVSSKSAVDLNSMDTAICGTTDKGMGVLNKHDREHFCILVLLVGLTRTMYEITLESQRVPDFDSAIIRGCNEEEMIWGCQDAVDRPSMFAESRNMNAPRAPRGICF